MTADNLVILLRGMACALAGQTQKGVITALELEGFIFNGVDEALFRIGHDYGEGMYKDLFTGNAPGLTIADYVDQAVQQAEAYLQSHPR